MKKSVKHEISRRILEVFEGDAQWKSIKVPAGVATSGMTSHLHQALLFRRSGESGDTRQGFQGVAPGGGIVTTDHISPAGNIAKDSPAGRYLISLVKPGDFNSYGAARQPRSDGARNAMNIRTESDGPGTGRMDHTFLPNGRCSSTCIGKYQKDSVPLLIIAGKVWLGIVAGLGSQGVLLLGVRP